MCEKAADTFAATHPEFFATAPPSDPQETTVGGADAQGAAPLPPNASEGKSDVAQDGDDAGASAKDAPPTELEMMQKDKDERTRQEKKDAEKKGAVRPGLDIVFLVHLQRGSDAMFNINFDHR